jgi:prophage regulatory protein
MTSTATRELIRFPEVERITATKRGTIYPLIRSGQFPQPVPIGLRAVAFVRAEVETWIQQRIESRETAAEQRSEAARRLVEARRRKGSEGRRNSLKGLSGKNKKTLVRVARAFGWKGDEARVRRDALEMFLVSHSDRTGIATALES